MEPPTVDGPPPAYTEEPPHESTTITFLKPGVAPPVFVAGTLTTPAWSPIEMTATYILPVIGSEPSYKFTAEFHNVPVGEYQYKFKLGTDEMWVVDQNQETTTDAAGNKNNVIRFPLVSKELAGDQSRELCVKSEH